MSLFGQGYRDAIQHVVMGIVFTIIINTLIATKFINGWYVVLFSLINVILIVVALLKLGKEGIIYLVGWILGIVILLYGNILGTGLIGLGELIVYLVVPSIFIGLKVFFWSQSR